MKQLYFGGDILTMVSEQDAPEAVVVEEGKILYVGTLEEAKALCGDDAEEINLEGKTLMPSFIDGHSHISMYSQFAVFPDVSKCKNFDEIEAFLKKYIEENPMPEGKVLLATGYDHNFLEEEAHPTRELLDRVSDTIPIYLYHSSGHMGIVNTPMLRLAGMPDYMDDPEGGHFGRFEDGRLNGYLEELPAFAPVMMKAYETFGTDPVELLKNVQQVYLKYGVTTVQDGGVGREAFKGFAQMAEYQLFQIDVVDYLMFNEEPSKTMAEYPQFAKKYHNHLKIDGAKIFLDGSPQGKSAWLTKPYEGEETYCGYPTQKDEVVIAAAEEAVEHEYQLLAHSNGDAASDQFIRCCKKAMETKGKPGQDLRPVMIHCQTVRDDQLKEMAEIGMVPSIFVAHTYYWGDVHLKNLGQERGSHISPVKSALDLGLKYNFHMDCPVLAPDMLQSVWAAVNRTTRKGVSIGPDQKISVFDALKGITINAAYGYHEEDTKGTLEAGKLADMVILGENPLKVDPMAINEIEILKTIKEGNILYTKE